MQWPLRAVGIKWRCTTRTSSTCSRSAASVLSSFLPSLAMMFRAAMLPSSLTTFSLFSRSMVMVSLASRVTFSEAAWTA